jgi:AcrR family transcriptional regulator
MPPHERRASLLEATIPLVAQHGRAVTTRQIADAAGVAEGTIFRVFATKEELVDAAIEAAMDPAPLLAEIAGIDTGAPLRERMLRLTEVMQRRFARVFGLFMALGHAAPPGAMKDGRGAMTGAAQVRRHTWSNEAVYRAVLAVLEPDADQLRYPADEVAAMLRLLTFAGSHPLINPGPPLPAEQIVSVLLDGVRSPVAERPRES